MPASGVVPITSTGARVITDDASGLAVCAAATGIHSIATATAVTSLLRTGIASPLIFLYSARH